MLFGARPLAPKDLVAREEHIFFFFEAIPKPQHFCAPLLASCPNFGEHKAIAIQNHWCMIYMPMFTMVASSAKTD